MDYEKKDIIRESKQLYGEINSCISDIINARIAKDLYNEGRSIFKMEGLMVGTMQHLGCVIDFLEEQKEQMLKDAVEGSCIDDANAGSVIDTDYGVLYLPPEKFHISDKVKLIIVKEE